MVRIYEPLEIREGPNRGKFHFTVRSDDERWMHAHFCCHNCPGHETIEGAKEHFRQYCLDGADFELVADSQLKCKTCGKWTRRRAVVRQGVLSQEFPLCAEHCNRENLEKVYMNA